MDEEKQPGIRFRGVHLAKLDFELTGPPPSQKLQFAPEFEAESEISEDGLILCLEVSGSLFPEDAPVRFRFKIDGVFEVSEDPNMSLDEFARSHAPAHLFPYIRELVSNITARSPLPTLNIGPLNLAALLKGKDSRLEITQSPKESEQV